MGRIYGTCLFVLLILGYGLVRKIKTLRRMAFISGSILVISGFIPPLKPNFFMEIINCLILTAFSLTAAYLLRGKSVWGYVRGLALFFILFAVNIFEVHNPGLIIRLSKETIALLPLFYLNHLSVGKTDDTMGDTLKNFFQSRNIRGIIYSTMGSGYKDPRTMLEVFDEDDEKE